MIYTPTCLGTERLKVGWSLSQATVREWRLKSGLPQAAAASFHEPEAFVIEQAVARQVARGNRAHCRCV